MLTFAIIQVRLHLKYSKHKYFVPGTFLLQLKEGNTILCTGSPHLLTTIETSNSIAKLVGC